MENNFELVLNAHEMRAMSKALAALKDKRGVKFAYFVGKNARILESAIKKNILAKQQLWPENEGIVKEFTEGEESIFKKYAAKDEHNNPVMKGMEYEIPDESVSEFQKEIDAFREANKEVVELFDEARKNIDKEDLKSVSLQLHRIRFEDLPQDISAVELMPIEDLIII